MVEWVYQLGKWIYARVRWPVWIPLDRDSSIPLYQQIQRFLREQIQSGTLLPETRLPASRELSANLGVSRVTVTNAYAELETEGLIYSRPGSGTFVAPLPADVPDPSRDYLSDNDWPMWQQELLNRAWPVPQWELDQFRDAAMCPDFISFGEGLGATELFPVDDFRKTLQTVLRRDGSQALGYGDRAGYPPLRATIAQIMTSQGIPTHPDQVLVTSGSHQALAMMAWLLLRPGDVVLVESPTYAGAIDLFRAMNVRLLGIPVDEKGMQVGQVEDALRTTRPRLVYTIPTFHNPTGVCLNGARRRRLVALASRYNVPILEDDFAGDLRYEGRPQPALRALDPRGDVIYISTFSKVLMPALRVGFLIAAGPVYERFLAYKRFSDLATSNLMQRALEAYITVGRYQAHLRWACREYRRRRDAMLTALARHAPHETRWITPQGGLFLWLQLPRGLQSNALYRTAIEEGVSFAPGSLFFPGQRDQSYLRLNFVSNPPDVIEEGIRRLDVAIRRCPTQKERESEEPRHRGQVVI
jgi:GntR family transcriptional regulator/MocR family aminotransferase